MIFLPYILFTILLFLIFYSKKIPFLKDINIVRVLDNISDFYILNLLIFATLITQFYTINLETLNWDINTYIVMGQDVLRGNLPYENHFDNKGPLFYFFYSIPVSFKNLHIIRVFNDLVLGFLICLIYIISKKLNPSLPKLYLLLPSFYFLLYMSYPIGHAGMSEIYCLVFIGLGINSGISMNRNKFSLFKTGLYFSISYLTSPSVVLLISTLSILIIIKNIKGKKLFEIIYFIIGAITPLAILMTIYASKNLLYELIFTLFIFPVIYTTSQNQINTRVFIDYLTDYLYLENYFALGLVTLFIFILFIFYLPKNIKNLSKFENENFTKSLLFVGTFFSIITFFNVAVPWWHYLIYYFFFSSFILISIQIPNLKNINSLLILLCALNVFPFMIRDNIKILTNLNNIYENYPIFSEYKFINERYKIESILPLNNHLILFYFDLPSSNYIVHPSNYEKSSYVNGLQKVGLLNKNEINNLINNGEIDLLVCNRFILEKCENSDSYEMILKSNENSFYFINKKTESK